MPFGIGLTIAEPGATKTKFAEGLVSPPPMAEYDNTPAGDVRRAVAAGAFPIPGDVTKMWAAIRTAMCALTSRHASPRSTRRKISRFRRT